MILTLALLLVAQEPIYVDGQGTMRWRADKREVALYGANYVITTASDYRAAGYVHADRKRAIDDDMAQFARMGWDGIRLTFWGDWEAADSAGNLIANDHLDLLDYLIARARERGIYMLFSPIQLYSSNWPDAMDKDSVTPGFGRVFGKGRMGTDAAARASQVNYLKQIMNHVNPYTHVAIKNEPNILFVELVNEPWHHPDDLQGSISYINALTDAVRSTGCKKLIFYNVSQDFRIGEAIRQSEAQGVTFGWYPTGLNSGHELKGNYLRTLDAYPDMLRPEIAKLPRLVYEFDTPDLRTGYMYPAMARTMRAVGGQVALMFAYDMLPTASRNLGWQTHYLSLAYTPRKAMSSVIAAEAMRRLPRLREYGPYPTNTRFGDFRVSYERNSSELVARDAFLYAGSTESSPPDFAVLRRVAGVGSSPIVTYEGTGAYFLDKVRAGVWRLEVYPDADELRDPFETPSVEKIVTLAVARAQTMTIRLPDLGPAFAIQALTPGGRRSDLAVAGEITVTPGVYVLSAGGPVARASLPDSIGHLGMAEYHAPPAETAGAAAPPAASAPLPGDLFQPGRDVGRLAFTRIGDAGRRGRFRIDTSAVTGKPVFHFPLPVTEAGWSPVDYTASLVVLDRLASADTLFVRLRALGGGPQQTLHVTLMEDDGTSWSTPVVVDSTWSERALPLSDFQLSRGVLLPQGFPGEWSYWVGPAAGRGGVTDRLRREHIERLQLSLRRGEGAGIEVEWVTLGKACCTVTLNVRVPEGSGTVYLAGNLPELGPWRPDGRALRGQGTDRTVSVTTPAGTTFEYKFTLGTWDREALTDDHTVPPNSQLAVARDTVIYHRVPAWKTTEDYVANWQGSGVEGRLVYWRDVASAFLEPKRNVVIWLPPGYDAAKSTRYPVLYMHDGQNLFDPRMAFSGVDWGVDEAVMKLVRRGTIPPIIVVGVWNSGQRTIEYSPWQLAPNYARFLIEELMPRVNHEFRTMKGPRNTAVMGSSMGGLLSFYLVTHHPEAFGACGCVSTHFPLSPAVIGQGSDTTPYITRDIAAGLRVPKGARYWFDYGSRGLDSAYTPSHEQVRAWLLRQGLVEGRDFVIRRYEGATHNEASWRARLEDPLTFLFGERRGGRGRP